MTLLKTLVRFLPIRSRWYNDRMASFVAYYDTSGHDHQRVQMVTGGLVTTERKWLQFDNEWQEALNNEVRYIHMREFVPGYACTHPQEADALIERCAKAIKRRVNKAFVVGLDVDDYEDVNKTYSLKEAYDTPLSCIGGVTVQAVSRWMKEKHPNDGIRHIHEKGDSGWTRCLKLLKGLNITLDFEPSEDDRGKRHPYFQAADMVAWIYRRVVVDKVEGNEGERYLKWFSNLRRLVPNLAGGLDRAALITHCEENPTLFPQREAPPATLPVA